MELLNYHPPASTINSSYQPEADTQVMKKPLYASSTATAHQSHNQAQAYQYQSDGESTAGQNNSSTATTTNDYDYKESYSYMLNPNEVSSIGSFSPANIPFNLAVLQSQQRSQSQSTPHTLPQDPHLQPQQHNQIQQLQQIGTSLVQSTSSLPHPTGFQPPQPIPEEQKYQLKSHSLPELKSAYPLVEYNEENKNRASTYPVPIYQHQPEPHYSNYQAQPHPPQGGMQGAGIQIPLNIDVNQYPDMTTLVNSNSNIVVPLVESQFVDHKVCSVCGKRITRDMSRHMRTHQSESRFTCKFPKSQCRHKSGKFNRPYDFKKHLLNRHFKFENLAIKRLHNLSDKLNHWGTCPCGLRFIGKDWLDEHILTEDPSKKCPCVD
ncbi:uncharacterized protein RJT20DRAFT_133725 [Scheffersomyces xylosifermentans]|uniref:uncharacterized protein n=1 Tax=Scheffersomyces xylosifermentans TaxID=1304137 RepID=UPI00315CA056